MDWLIDNKIKHVVKYNRNVKDQYSNFEINLYNRLMNIYCIQYILLQNSIDLLPSVITNIYDNKTMNINNPLCENLCTALKFLFNLKENRLKLDLSKVIHIYYLLTQPNIGQFRDDSIRSQLENEIAKAYEFSNPILRASYIHCAIYYLKPFTTANSLLAKTCESFFLVEGNMSVVPLSKEIIPVYEDIIKKGEMDFEYALNNYTSLLADILQEQLEHLNDYGFPK